MKSTLTLLTALLLAPLAGFGATVDLQSQWDETIPLANPHKGWYHHYPDNHINKYQIAKDADLLKFPGMDHVYIRLAWAYLEPREGQFDWPVIDRIIEKWTAHGLGISFRISCKESSADRVEQQYATPRWVKDAGARGGFYSRGQIAGPEAPWEPVFDDPIFLQKLENFLKAFAARYDGKPWLRYVDIGSIGDWGEGHTWAGSRTECSFATRLKHVDLHLKYFKRSQLVISDDYVYSLPDSERQAMHRHIISNGISYRDDSILVNGYLQGLSDRFTVRSPEFFADAYLKTPTVFELEHYGKVKKLGNWEAQADSSAAKYGKGKTGPDYFRGALELLHATYIGYHGYAHEWLVDNPALTGELLNRCGYWFFPHKVEFPDVFIAGQTSNVSISWQNRGVAPAYHPFALILRLEGPDPCEVELPSGNTHWLPGPPVKPWCESYLLTVPGTCKPGDYDLKFKLYSREAAREVKLPLKARLLDQRGYYTIGKVRITK